MVFGQPRGREAGTGSSSAKRSFVFLLPITNLIPFAQEVPSLSNADFINSILMKISSGEKIDPAEFGKFIALQNTDPKSGPAVGTKVPDFTLPDQNGKNWSLADLTGPKGMLLVFTRSADW
jgi:AhpC/TSA family